MQEQLSFYFVDCNKLKNIYIENYVLKVVKTVGDKNCLQLLKGGLYFNLK